MLEVDTMVGYVILSLLLSYMFAFLHSKKFKNMHQH